MARLIKQKKNMPSSNACTYCGASYRRADFAMCPHCGGDGGGFTPRVWKPSKAQAKSFVNHKGSEGSENRN